MFNRKLFFIVVLGLVMLSVSCAMDDDADLNGEAMDIANKVRDGYNAPFLISLSNFGHSDNKKFDFIQSDADSLSEFPSDTTYHNAIKNCILRSQSQAFSVVNSLFNSKRSTWMDFYEPYYGTFTSPDDSRIKQWQLDTVDAYGDNDYAYSLTIFDMPEGTGTDSKKNPALEFFYNDGFSDGVVVFSPVNFDKVSFPEGVFGHNIMCKLTFSYTSDKVMNELVITNLADNENSVYYIHNVYLKLIYESQKETVKFQCLIDMPNLWFDTPENSGYCVCSVGTVDDSNGATVLYSGLVKDDDKSDDTDYLINQNSSGPVLTDLLMLSLQETEEDTVSTDDPGLEVTNIVSPLFDNPAYFVEGDYVGFGTITNKDLFYNAKNQTLNLMEEEFPLSPYKVSIYQIEW